MSIRLLRLSIINAMKPKANRIVIHSKIGKINTNRRILTAVATKPYFAKVRVKSYLYNAIDGKKNASKVTQKRMEAQIP